MKNSKIYIYLILTYIAMQIGGLYVGRFLFQYFKGDTGLTLKEAEYHAIAWSLFSVNVIAAIVFLAFILVNKKFLPVFKGKPATIGITVLWGFLGFFIAMIGQVVAGMIEMQFGVEPGSENTAILSEIAKVSPIIIISIVLFAPFLEEIVFRRILFGGLYNKTNFFVAALVSAVVFAAVHGELQHLLIYMAPALTFSYIYYRTKRLLAPILSHLLMNGFVVIVQLNYEKLEQLQNLNTGLFTLFH